MADSPKVECRICGSLHARQAFVSHASRDEQIADAAQEACCRAGVAPYLFEFSREFSQPNIDIARTIAGEIKDSEFFLVLLSPSVSNAFWTQAWIGFEIGVYVGTESRSGLATNSNYFPPNIFVIQDIRQEVSVAVPRIDVLLLFDFESGNGWTYLRDLIRFMILERSDDSYGFFSLGNELRQQIISTKATCGNQSCRSMYDVLVLARDLELMQTRMSLAGEGIRANAIVKCPSCGQDIEALTT